MKASPVRSSRAPRRAPPSSRVFSESRKTRRSFVSVFFSISLPPATVGTTEGNYKGISTPVSREMTLSTPPPRSEKKPRPPTAFPQQGRPFRRTPDATGDGTPPKIRKISANASSTRPRQNSLVSRFSPAFTPQARRVFRLHASRTRSPPRRPQARWKLPRATPPPRSSPRCCPPLFLP